MKQTDLLIIGASNPVIISAIEDINYSKSLKKYNIVGILDNDAKKKNLLGYPVMGGFDLIDRFSKSVALVNTVASSCSSRAEVTSFFSRLGRCFENIVHPSVDTRHIHLGVGNIVYEKAMLHPGVRIGSFNIISSMAGIAHDTQLEDNNFIGPNSYICGRVRIGSNCFFGVSSSVAPRANIGSDCVIAAASFVKDNVKSGSRVKGIPAKVF
jgi:sugar O-acyltransferase (sialic acid O-acetyltransferase NeuD family)